MKKILYLSNIQVPYRVRFFNELAKYCDLTVLYERSVSGSRDSTWCRSVKENYKPLFLDGIKIGNESTFSFTVIKHILDDYDSIIIGCYSTPVQILANIVLRVLNKPFFMNFDGEVFASDKTIKTFIKKFVIRGASSYLVGGERSARSVQAIVGNKKNVYPYFFSPFSREELENNKNMQHQQRENYILVVGQYFDYKGLDVALKVAKQTPEIQYKFVGMGKRTDLFINENNIKALKNVEVIPFLQKNELQKEYMKCRLLLLPSKQECWGLVINEAASYGTPVVSTDGAGAAVEFLSERYPEFVAKAADPQSLKNAIVNAFTMDDYTDISKYLIMKSEIYCIENNVNCHLKAIEQE